MVRRSKLEKKLKGPRQPRQPQTFIGRGFGYVSFETKEMQQKVISEMNDKTVKGRNISVKAATDYQNKGILDSKAGEGFHKNKAVIEEDQTDAMIDYSVSDKATTDYPNKGVLDPKAGEGFHKNKAVIEEDQTDAMIDYSASDPSQIAALGNVSNGSVDNGPADKGQPQTLADLAPDDLTLQLKYFYVTQNPREVDLAGAVRCLVCMRQGHMAETCGTLLCTHCGLYRDHFSNQCPNIQKCRRCRERGHKQDECPYKLGRLAMNGLVCDLCQRKGHVEAKCELLWRTSGKPWESDVARKGIRRSCYECGSNRHLGNDCPTRKPGKPMGSSTWTLGENNSEINESKDGTAIKGRAQQNSSVAGDDSDDDQANFYRPRIPQPARSGQIRIASGSLNRYQGDSWASSNEPERDHRTGGRRDDSYRDSCDYDSHSYRPNERRRSLSPQPRYSTNSTPKGGYDGSNNRRPPLPRGPPPRRARKGGKGAHANKNTYKPMPSAAKGAWSKHRT